MSSLTLSSVSKTFPGAHQPSVNGVDLEIAEGSLVTLLGPSGCGKTTLLRLITGFLQPDAGSILIGGEDVTRLPPHRRDIGMVYQNFALWPHMSVLGNVAFGLEMRGVPRTEREARARRILDLVGLSAYADRSPVQLSGGQQQRVALARALVIQPRVLLLDEPLSSLDANLRKQLRLHIREIQQQLGVTTVFVTHDQEEALALSDQVVLMREGRIIQVGSGAELYSRPASSFAMKFMGDANVVRGVVREITADRRVAVDTPLGEVSCVAAGSLAVGDRVDVGIRPEDLTVEAGVSSNGTHEGELRFPAQVRSARFLGPWVRLEVEAGEPPERVEVRLASAGADGNGARDGIAVGDRVTVRVPAEAVTLLH